MTNKWLTLLFSLDERLQSYFLLDICLITLAHHHWTFKQALSMFIDKKKLLRKIAFKGYFGITYSETLMDQRPKDESCERQWPEAIDKASSDSKAVNKVIL